MPVRLSLARRAAPLLILLPVLAGCGPGRGEFAPACPAANLLETTSDLVEYRPNSSGRDMTDLVLRARATGIRGECHAGDKGKLDVTVTTRFEFARGPAMQGNSLVVPIFVAVTEGGRILTKKVYSLGVSFPPNVDRVPIVSDPIELTLPVGPDKSGAAYTILAGFQLTPDQLQANRARNGGR